MEKTLSNNAAMFSIINFFESNNDLFNECIEQLDAWNGYLGDDRCYSMDLLDEIYQGSDASEILRRAFYGHDAGDWTMDASGNKIYGSFNPNRDYFYFNGCGNLVSTDYIDYSDKLDDYVIAEMLEHRDWIDAIDESEELSGLFDELEKQAAAC